MSVANPTFGEGAGQAIGGALGAQDLQAGLNNVGEISGNFNTDTNAYNNFGQSFLQPATNAINTASSASGNTEGYNDFMKNYTNTPAVQYQLGQADTMQNNTAASKGQVLSGANLRSLSTINNGIISQGANTAYNEYLAGNNQQFGQLESALGNMFSAIGVGTTATGQQASVANSEIGANSQIAQAQAKNDQSKGGGIGSMFSGIGSLATAF